MLVTSTVPGEGGAARLLATAAGVTFGLTAAVTLSATRLLRDVGPAAVLAHWQPWVLIVLGLAGLLLSQSAYQAGQLTASLPIIDTLEPISAVVLGAVIFHERLASSPLMLAVQLAGGVVDVEIFRTPAMDVVQVAGGLDVPLAVGVYRITHFSASNERNYKSLRAESNKANEKSSCRFPLCTAEARVRAV